jgi:hypothetical protein
MIIHFLGEGMIIPFVANDLFRVNENLEVQFVEDVIIIDDYYKNYDKIYEVLINMPVPRWKWSSNTRNFKDYYDCRPRISNSWYSVEYEMSILNIYNIIKKYYNDKEELSIERADYEFNYLKHIKNIPDNNFQFYPHTDSTYASIIFLDKISSGGTAIYKDSYDITNKEDEYLFYDVGKMNKRVIKSKPNRHIIFKSTNYHGGYIEDHKKYINDWRINQVMFYNKKVKGDK